MFKFKYRFQNPFHIMKEWCKSTIQKFKKSRADNRFNNTTIVIPFMGYDINMVLFHRGYMYRAEITQSNCLVVDFKNEPVMDLRLLAEIFSLVKKNMKGYPKIPVQKQR